MGYVLPYPDTLFGIQADQSLLLLLRGEAANTSLKSLVSTDRGSNTRGDGMF